MRSPVMSVGHGGLYHSQSPEVGPTPRLMTYLPRASSLVPTVSRSLLCAPPSKQRAFFLPPSVTPTRQSCLSPRSCTAPLVRTYKSLTGLLTLTVEEVPVDDFTLPLGTTDTILEGTDLTVVSYGTPLYTTRKSH